MGNLIGVAASCLLQAARIALDVIVRGAGIVGSLGT